MFKVVYLTKEEEYRREVEAFLAQWSSGEEFIVAHTSGSTGVPKEIHLSKQDMTVSANATGKFFHLGPDSRLLCPLSAGYIAGKMMVARAIVADCEVAFCKPSNRFLNIKEVSEYMRRGADLLPIVPSQSLGLLDFMTGHPSKTDISPIKNVIIGGAAIPRDTETALLSSRPEGMEIFATYGMTETCSHVALRPLGRDYFTAMPGISFSLDEMGCLKITAPEYSFKTLQTKDIAELAGADRFIWRGRLDNVINSGGIKIFPEELERKLEGKLPVRFYFKGVPDRKWGEAVTMVIDESSCHIAVTDLEIMEICRCNLAPFELPRHIYRVNGFASTHSGKLKRI